MRAWMKYWLMAVSSAERTSCRTLRISGLPCMRPPGRAPRAGAGSYPGPGDDVSFRHERKGSADSARRRVGAPALERGVREILRQGGRLEEGLDHGLGRSDGAARRP